MFEKLCGNVVLANLRHVHEKQAPVSFVSTGDMPFVCESEEFFPSELALFSCHVFTTFEKSGSENVQGSSR